MPDSESPFTVVAIRKGDALYESGKAARASPGIPLGMKAATPEQIRAAWASRDKVGRTLLAKAIGIEAIVRAHIRRRP